MPSFDYCFLGISQAPCDFSVSILWRGVCVCLGFFGWFLDFCLQRSLCHYVQTFDIGYHGLIFLTVHLSLVHSRNYLFGTGSDSDNWQNYIYYSKCWVVTGFWASPQMCW